MVEALTSSLFISSMNFFAARLFSVEVEQMETTPWSETSSSERENWSMMARI